jgi:hypothetical protein
MVAGLRYVTANYGSQARRELPLRRASDPSGGADPTGR